MKGNSASFRVGKVRAYRRGKIWYLHYYEAGQRRRPRVGPDRDLARQMAAQINGQLETGAPATLSFEPISIPDLRQRWLDHHEHVRRSSVQTIRRYRAATEHLLAFVRDVRPVRLASDFRSRHAEDFVHCLRSTKVAPNGHPKARKRPLRDSGIKFILGDLLQPVQLRPATSAPLALRGKSLSHDRGQPDTGRRLSAGRHLHRRAGAEVPRSLRRLAVPAVHDVAADRHAAGRTHAPAAARRPRPREWLAPRP